MASPTSSPVLVLFVLLQMVLSTVELKPTMTAQTFRHLVGCRKDHTAEGVSELKQFVDKLGYLNHDGAKDDKFDEDLESGIKAYQVNYQLNVTGSLDDDTLKQMMKPRCGIADLRLNGDKNSKSVYRFEAARYEFFLGNLKWPISKTHLTYNFRSSVEVPLDEDIRSICFRSFERWADVSRFTFEEVSDDYIADIEIGFHSGDHGDGNPFDGPQGTLAHASPPTGGKLHYDADENWSTNPGPDEIDLESVTVHEIGHLLGLQHSMIPDAVMYAYFDSGVTKRRLNRDDVHGIRALYGLL
ncbi:histone 2 [Hibiscus syriacus]|uniref:Histone 2 n=1 Tax=Hibiscus syriacus TaxID=106335 RepID=A0A6A3BSN2_HIBSY|nr:metalloendoproteinase 5-MMP-like [Hibiscus syriacus]KAE8717929.1 histone 2 [Hibiscus syriacus]